MAVKGLERVRKNLRAQAENIDKQRTDGAVYAILSQGAAMSQTMTPIDTTNLFNSQYAPQISHSNGKTKGRVGYTAHYAKAVHEAPGKLKGQPRADFGVTREGVTFGGGTGRGNYWDPNAEPGFLRKGFNQIKPAIPAILKEAYRV